MMHKELKGRPDLIEKLIPECASFLLLTTIQPYSSYLWSLSRWDLWCRRVTPCLSFMDALHQPQVDLITEPIESISAHGVTTVKGTFVEVDRIILATGFDTSFKPKYEIRAKGKTVGEVWAKRPKGAETSAPQP